MDQNETRQPEPGKSPLIRNLIPGLPEIGKIKIGRKGELRQGQNGQWRVPVKLDHFIVTTLERDKDENFIQDAEIMKRLGEKPKKIPIRLLFDSIEGNFQSRYTCYNGKTLWCSGDGEAAFQAQQGKPEKQQVKCPCGRQLPEYRGKDKCKMNGKLSCIIDGADLVGGVWVFRTTGYNSTVGMTSSLALIRTFTGGLLAGLELDMTVQPKVATDPDGKSVTIQVVGIVFRGSLQQLQQKTLEIAKSNAEFRHRISHVEQEVQRLISVDADAIDQSGDIVDEFYQEEPKAELIKPEQMPKMEQAAVQTVGAPVQAQAQPVQAQPDAQPETAAGPVQAPAAAPRGRKPKQAPASPAAPAPAQATEAPAPQPEQQPATAPLTQPEDATDFDLFD